MNWSANSTASTNDVGPLELLYSLADQLLAKTQSSNALLSISDFVDSVRWNEPFIRALLLTQFTLFLLTYLTRRRQAVQFAILFVITVVALAAEKLNMLGKQHWRTFATQNYFDRAGLFMLIFVSGPFVLVANFIVVGMGLRLVRIYAKKQQREAVARMRAEAGSSTADNKKDS